MVSCYDSMFLLHGSLLMLDANIGIASGLYRSPLLSASLKGLMACGRWTRIGLMIMDLCALREQCLDHEMRGNDRADGYGGMGAVSS